LAIIDPAGRTIARPARRRYKAHGKRLWGWIWRPAGAAEGLRKMAIEFGRAVPIFRIFSLDKAREFYIDFLGCKVDWEHRFTPDAPVYMQVSREGLAIHLSEHHGDGTPGSIVYVYTRGVEELHRELNDKNYRHNHPGLQQQEWGMLELAVVDPFNNRIVFAEYREHLKHSDGSLP
jgi:catechol 2,3-dioxygenase-like lactoylglutathione lyase family enzyme